MMDDLLDDHWRTADLETRGRVAEFLRDRIAHLEEHDLGDLPVAGEMRAAAERLEAQVEAS